MFCAKEQIFLLAVSSNHFYFKGYLDSSLRGRNVTNILNFTAVVLFQFLDVNTNIIRHFSHLSEMADIFVPNTGTQEEAQSSLEGRMQGDALVECVRAHVCNSIVKCCPVNIFTDMTHNSVAIYIVKKRSI